MAGRSARRGISILLFLSAVLLCFLATFLHHNIWILEPRDEPLFGNRASQHADPVAPLGRKSFSDDLHIRYPQPETNETLDTESSPRENTGAYKRDITITWSEALRQGQESLDLLNGARRQSQWNSLTQVENRGWEIKDDEGRQLEKFYDQTGGAYQSLGIDSAGDHQIRATQTKRYSNCYHFDLPETGATFTRYYNIPGRTIIAVSNYGPKYRLANEPPSITESIRGRPPKEERMPEIYAWSDIVWLLWSARSRQLGQSPSSLKYIFRHEIVTENTRFIMNLAEPMSGATWPGHRFERGSDEFRALLGTSHGRGVAFLVATHPGEMGGKDVESVNCFVTRDAFGRDQYHMLWVLSG